MHTSVIGTGYLGAVHAAAMAELGHDVVAYDVDTAKIEQLRAGKAPFHEPGLDGLLATHVATGRLRFTTDPADIAGQRVHFVCVGTPQTPGSNSADLRYVNAAIETVVAHASPGDVIVGKSTVPVGTAARLRNQLASSTRDVELTWNPEFLREGFAVQDTLEPDRLVYGSSDGQVTPGVRALDETYQSILDRGTPRMVTDYATAELVKVAANSFLATKISFINAISEICDVTGADVTQLATAIGYDDRIGAKFLRAGVGFGGGCLPKDIRAFQARADELGLTETLGFLAEVDAINGRSRQRVINAAVELLDGDVTGKRIAVLGAAFKPLSDDLRDSPALAVGVRLVEMGANVCFVDPAANGLLRGQRPDLAVHDDIDDALIGAEAVLLLTEWSQFIEIDPAAAGRLVERRIMIDGRNALDPKAWRAAGWTYRGMGRP